MKKWTKYLLYGKGNKPVSDYMLKNVVLVAIEAIFFKQVSDIELQKRFADLWTIFVHKDRAAAQVSPKTCGQQKTFLKSLFSTWDSSTASCFHSTFPFNCGWSG